MQLLIVGSLGGHLTSASQIAMKRGAKVTSVHNGEEAMQAIRAGFGADIILADARLDIAALVISLEQERINVPVVACGLEGTPTEAAVAAIKAGAKEYLPLPPDPELIAAVLEAVVEESNAIIHQDPAMKQVLQLADQIAPSPASVLITGESGTGKEVMARYIHAKSRRSSKPFIALNCAAIPENLLESELFGHEKGAFSGAVARRIGKFEQANGGTLLLDEISEMDPRLQAKLLRAVQEREIDRVGGSAPVKVDVRLLATSNRNLEKEVQAGNFREDLYFRLNVVNVRLPALRERPSDIPALISHFVEKYAELNGVPNRKVSPGAMSRLNAYSWPGNVRELENTMHRAILLSQGDEIADEAVVLSTGPLGQSAAQSLADATSQQSQPAPVQPTHTDGGGDGPVPGSMVGQTVSEVERGLIIDTLQHCLGNRTHAANILGISIRTLRNKLKQYQEEGHSVPTPGSDA